MKLRTLLFIFIFLPFPTFLSAQFSLSPLFSDHMVLQRDQPVRVWGWAHRGDRVRIQFLGEERQTRLTATGRWEISFPAQPAGGPFSMQISYNGEVIQEMIDILFGDVWVCSGQSNMEWTVANSNDAEREIAAVKDSRIRHFKVPRSSADTPQENLTGGAWVVAAPETLGDFTAVGYYFAKNLRRHQDVPIGLLNTSWGGSRIEAWMAPELFGAENAQAIIAEKKAEAKRAWKDLVEGMKERFPGLSDTDAGLVGEDAPWADPELNTAGWGRIQAPNLWENEGYDRFDGIAWYRKEVVLQEADLKGEVSLGLAKIDDSDITWVNGQEIGRTLQAYNKLRVYPVPTGLLRPGRNVITVRVEDTGGGGGIYGEAENLYLATAEKRIPLAGGWDFKPSALLEPNQSMAINQTHTLLYNQMVHPLLSFPIKGALWYQGESNTGDADIYADQFKRMIRHWRAAWRQGDFPFLFVQLANFMAATDQPGESAWAELRAAQSETLALPNTAQVVIIDIGEAADIHPRNKQDVGLRLSLAARAIAYGEDIPYSGPVYASHRVTEGKVYIRFEHLGGGLVARDRFGYLKEFAVAGSDGQFHWAKAWIEGDEVVVWSEQVPDPVRLRYAWGDNPAEANLYNEAGLPVSPFEIAIKK